MYASLRIESKIKCILNAGVGCTMGAENTEERYSTMEQPWWANDYLILLLTLFNIGIVIYDLETGLQTGTSTWWTLAIIDLILILFFIADLGEDYTRCRDKTWWWKSHGWEILSLFPLILTGLPFLGSGVVLRIFRLFRAFAGIFRLIGATKRAKEFTVERQVFHLISIVLVLIVAGAFFVYVFEKEYYEENCESIPEDDLPKECDRIIHTYPSSIWWAIVTTTTVGYGEFAPVTLIARVVAALLMLIGIGLVGSLAATLSQVFYSTKDATMVGKDDVGRTEDILNQLDRFTKRYSEGWLEKETYDTVVTIMVRRMNLELMMLKKEMGALSTLPIPIQVASKMELNSQIENTERILEEIENKVNSEEE